MSADSSAEKTPTFRERVRSILIDRAALDEHIEEFFDEVLDDIETVHREESRTNQPDREVTVSTTINSEPDNDEYDEYQHREITRTCFRAQVNWGNDGDGVWMYQSDLGLDVCHLHERDSSALCTEPHGIDCSCASGCPACDPEPEPARWSSETAYPLGRRIEQTETWRDWCKHYGGCVTHGNRDLCTAPDDPAYIAERVARDPSTPPGMPAPDEQPEGRP